MLWFSKFTSTLKFKFWATFQQCFHHHHHHHLVVWYRQETLFWFCSLLYFDIGDSKEFSSQKLHDNFFVMHNFLFFFGGGGSFCKYSTPYRNSFLLFAWFDKRFYTPSYALMNFQIESPFHKFFNKVGQLAKIYMKLEKFCGFYF